MNPADFTVHTLGAATHDSPLLEYEKKGFRFTNDTERILLYPDLRHYRLCMQQQCDPLCFEKAGPRRRLYFNPLKLKSAIVTAGGLCPGLNDVIRSLVMELHYRYHTGTIYGIRHGYKGLSKQGFSPVILEPELVENIHMHGGTILGSSRGYVDPEEIVDRLMSLRVSILFAIGGDGTLHGAQAIADIIARRGLRIAVVGIPKTIDNDISFIEKTFGFETAFSLAVNVIRGAHVEAKGAINGIGLVKLMGRHSGFVAASAALAQNDANFVLVPEIPFDLTGPNGLLHHLDARMRARHHAVIIVAEGAGQQLLPPTEQKDKSGNVKLADIGRYLMQEIKAYFSAKMEVNVKYFDPSYLIRSLPATASDSIFCADLARMAVHAGMAGKTNMVVGRWNTVFTHVPIHLAISKRKHVDPQGNLWINVLEATGQPPRMKN